MKATDRAVLVGLALAGLIAVFWFMVLSPKRQQAAELSDEVTALQASVSEAEQLVIAGEQARDGFARNYQRLVVLGKAVPADDDTSSLFVQLDEIAGKAGVEFDSIFLDESSAGAAPAAPAAETAVDGAAPAPSSADGAVTTTAPAVATEAAAAVLPMGAAVGPAGLPVMPYKVSLRGSFFELADFLAGVDRLVAARKGRELVDGRLITIDGFGLQGDPEGGFETLDASLAVTTYLTPADEGLTAGAVPGAPPAAPDASIPAPPPTTTAAPAQ